MVDPAAKLADDVSVGAFAFVGPQVRLARGVVVRPHAHICGRTSIGAGSRVFPFAVVGDEPQDKDFPRNVDTELVIGERNEIREHCSIHRGTPAGGGATRIGNDNLFMNGSHVGHDAQIGSQVIVASNAALGGHCELQDYAVIGGLCGVHQFARIGESAIVGGLSGVSQDAPPFSMVVGERARITGINKVGLRNRGFSLTVRREIKRAYQLVFHSELRLTVAIARIREEGLASAEVARLLDFLSSSKRGVSRFR